MPLWSVNKRDHSTTNFMGFAFLQITQLGIHYILVAQLIDKIYDMRSNLGLFLFFCFIFSGRRMGNESKNKVMPHFDKDSAALSSYNFFV